VLSSLTNKIWESTSIRELSALTHKYHNLKSKGALKLLWKY
jgi:hypothetical protein